MEAEWAFARYSVMPSTVIRTFDYHPGEQALDVTFTSGRRYRYAGVPAQVVHAFAQAQSKGRFFNARVRDAYAYVELPDEVPDEELWAL